MIQLKRGPTSAIQNDILEDGQLGYDTQTQELKIGNGSTSFEMLPRIIPDPRVYTSSQDLVSINKGEYSLTWDGTTLGYMNVPSATIGSNTNMWHEMYVHAINNVQTITAPSTLTMNSPRIDFINPVCSIRFDTLGLYPSSDDSNAALGATNRFWSGGYFNKIGLGPNAGYYNLDIGNNETTAAISMYTSRNPDNQIIIVDGKTAPTSPSGIEDFAIKYTENAQGAGRLGIYTNNNEVYLTVGDTGPIYKRNTDAAGNEIPILELYTWTPRVTVDGTTQTVTVAHGTAVKNRYDSSGIL